MATFFGWQFTEHQYFGLRRWRWRCVAIDGSTTEHSSNDFSDYGSAVYDAIRSAGFRPAKEAWSVVAFTGVTHFVPDQLDPGMRDQFESIYVKSRSGRSGNT